LLKLLRLRLSDQLQRLGSVDHGIPCSQKTRRGPNPPEKSKFLLLIDVSVSAAFNELVVEPVQQKIRQPTTAEDEGGQTAGLPGLQIRRPVEIAK
jgi:hypothetical protein